MVHFEPDWPRRKLTGHLLWFLAWAFVTTVGLLLTPSANGHGTHTQLGLPPCPSVIVFQRPCPGCGLTTSFTSFLHGDVTRAFSAHAVGPILYIAFTLSAWACLYGFIRGRRFNTDSRSFSFALGTLVTVLVAFGVIRFFAVSNLSIFSPPMTHGDGRGSRS